jgi:hypothetical protein
MQVFGFLTLTILMFMLLEIEIVSTNPCSQFSDPNRQALCSTDNYPSSEIINKD